ncbi:uncharacterized protein LOC133390984 [Anopheles gambiae]|uniref:uncharacterized protein LOC133390984 n=1 Tax=Anopheles gambiae TaxID=7165 RepID=UPI002AC95354|nr:uncharacterized protein LOC133390984 [Anopheles gambiae]
MYDGVLDIALPSDVEILGGCRTSRRLPRGLGRSPIARLLRNHSGPRASKAKLLASVSESVMRYTAPVWSNELRKREPGRLLERVQRKMRVARAFRTVRYETATLLAGLTPICLLVDDDARVHQRLSAANRTDTRANIRKQATIQEWQQQWDAKADTSRHTRWAYRVLPNIS